MPNHVNCYPSCSEDSITKKLLLLNPCIDIKVLKTSTFFQDTTSTITKFKDFIDAYKNQTSDITLKDLTSSSGLSNAIDKVFSMPETFNSTMFTKIYGYLSLLSTDTESIFENIPICSSPNISVSHGAGFESEQSLFSFIQSVINSTSSFLGGLAGAASSAVGVAEWFVGLAGFSPRLSPYFSFKANPFSSTPSFSADLKLINDSKTHAEDNEKFLQYVIKDSLVRRDSLPDRWLPPKLFTVRLKFGSGGKIIKTFHFCKLTSTVTPEGLMRQCVGEGGSYQIRFPDAYSVSLNFQSIFPETTDLWGADGRLNYPNP